MTRLGDLDTRIAWLQPTTVDDGVGGQTVTWATESYAWAEVVPAGGRESLMANALHPSGTHRITTWQKDAVTVRWRIQDVETDTLYELLSITKPDRVWMLLEAVEVVA